MALRAANTVLSKHQGGASLQKIFWNLLWLTGQPSQFLKDYEVAKNQEAVMLELEQLSNYNAELHQSCDFILENCDIRQTGRDEEIEESKQAKAILSGANLEEFLQGA